MSKRRIHGRKLEPGRCTVCGCAVVRPDRPVAELPDGWHGPGVGGHLVLDGQLWDVRCAKDLPDGFRGTACSWPTQTVP